MEGLKLNSIQMQHNVLVSRSALPPGLRAMTSADYAAIEQMFFAIFRPNRRSPDPAFLEYFDRLFFTGPTAGQGGGLVSQDGDEIGSAIALMPITYIAHDRQLTARLACAFMSRAPQSKAAARVVLSLRARGQDMLFTDSGATTAVGHWTAGGSMVVPVNSLDWQCTFRPVAYAAQRLGLPRAIDGLWAVPDRIVAGRRKHLPINAPADFTISLSAYAARAPEMISHFAVRPKWERTEMEWQLRMAAENRPLGELRFFSVGGEKAIGAYAYFTNAQGIVRVLDILALPGKEADVVRALYNRLEAEGVVEARGSAHPHLLAALSPLPGMRFRHRAFTCVATRHQDIRDAIARNDIYIGGLAGESWSRLMTDFY
jgi:hypothetical protein